MMNVQNLRLPKQTLENNTDKLKAIFKAISPIKPLHQTSNIAKAKDLQKQLPERIKSVKLNPGAGPMIEDANLAQVKALNNMSNQRINEQTLKMTIFQVPSMKYHKVLQMQSFLSTYSLSK